MKKVKPADQTQELRRAKLEFLKRNRQAYKAFVAAYKRLLDGFEGVDTEELLAESLQRPAAANASLQFMAAWIKGTHNMDGHPLLLPTEEKAALYREQILTDARGILERILAPFESAADCLLISCDLTRPKKVILAEFERVLDNELQTYRRATGHEWVEPETGGWEKETLPQSRAKWLGRADELLEVWDLHKRAGKQSALKTFEQIARKIGRPVSTIKDQWRLAYEKIYGEPYTPELKFSSEEKRREAEELCAVCTEQKCYRKQFDRKTGVETLLQIPCKEYLELAGVERKLKTVEYSEQVLYGDMADD